MRGPRPTLSQVVPLYTDEELARLIRYGVKRDGRSAVGMNAAIARGRFLASIVCSECHGADFNGSELEGGPSLAILALYGPDQFRHLLRTGKPIDGRDLPKVDWMPDVGLTAARQPVQNQKADPLGPAF